ncbi:MAG: cytochrome C oxidase subunit II [Gammaproteobacteria bacterium]
MDIDAIKQKLAQSVRETTAELHAIHVDPLEKKWIVMALIIVCLLIGIIGVDAMVHGINPPGRVETVDSASLHLSEEFAEDNLGLQLGSDGKIVVRMVAGRYGFFPKHVTVPADTPVTFRWVSMDVLHGVHMPMTNLSTMIVPGYVAQLTTVLPKPGEYPLLCNEYCGMGHDHMWSNITVVAKEHWAAPAPIASKGDRGNE